ncbi:MAG: 5-(carboxyamino)imidazole ribonucleotide synthase [Luteibaculaceae bacterium]
MEKLFNGEKKIGIVGGGQLGRMLIQEGINYNLNFSVLDPSSQAPCATLANHFTHGDWKDFDTVYNFGKNLDVITIEFEDVAVDALAKLEEEGKEVYPQPHVLSIIKDKGLQKQFYKDNDIPTMPFVLVTEPNEAKAFPEIFPAFQKLRTSGYDGYGVKKIASVDALSGAMPGASVFEKCADIQKELSVIVCRSKHGEIKTFPTVEMEFSPVANMVEFLFAPADIEKSTNMHAHELAVKIAAKLQIVGLLAVEFFLLKTGELYVNEVAPRPHNSGHHTIEACYTSQYDQHLRAILGMPLGSTESIQPAIMLNLLGEPNAAGKAVVKGADFLLNVPGAYLHLYGKTDTKPYRKMGHITILGSSLAELKPLAYEIKDKVKVTA